MDAHPPQCPGLAQRVVQSLRVGLEHELGRAAGDVAPHDGGVEFLRSYVEAVYGLPKERVIGSQVKTDYQLRDGRPELLRAQRVHFSDERGGKAATIQHYLGRRPRLVMGNAAGDEAKLANPFSGPGGERKRGTRIQP